jgi:hypothetical protein
MENVVLRKTHQFVAIMTGCLIRMCAAVNDWHDRRKERWMRLETFSRKLPVLIAIAASLLGATQVADAGCQRWNGCMWRTEKKLAELRSLGSAYIGLTQKCIDALNAEQSIVALRYFACMDAATYGQKVQEILSDGDVQDHLTADDKILHDEIVKNSYAIARLAQQYETPAEREANRQAAEQKLADARAEEAHSAARRAAIIGALAAGAEGAANATNQQAARPPSYTCFTQAAPGGAGGSTTCLPH